MEDLERLVRVQGHDGLGDRMEVSVEEGAQPPAVLERARAGASGDEELEAGRAERVLHVDEEQAESGAVAGRGLEAVLGRPGRRVREPRLVLDSPHVADALEVRRDQVRRERTRAGRGKARTTRSHGATPDHHGRNEERHAWVTDRAKV